MPIRVNQGQTIYAKGIDQYGNETRIISSHVVHVTNALGPEAYDGNDGTYAYNFSSTSPAYLNIDESVRGGNISIYWKAAYLSNTISLTFENINGENISTITRQGTETRLVTIPENATRLKIHSTTASRDNIVVYEITPVELSNNYLGLVPKMTSNVLPSPFEITASSYHSTSYMPYMAFDQVLTTGGWASAVTDLDDGNAWLRAKLNEPKTVRRYYLMSRNDGYPEQAPKTWKLQGSVDGNNWIDLDSQENQTSWKAAEIRWFNINNNVAYQYYRILITESNGSNGKGNIAIDQFNLFE